ncbi:MAG: crotonase/enoyl-CoA hydratase family protein [Betaproteobacteria bacterium]|jgi:enoyl-CoA hydratase/carnithine racemase
MSTSFDPLKQGADAPILFSLEGHVAVLTLNRPATRNALSGEEMFRAFETIFDYMNQNTQVRASVLTGAGTAFCSGGNITEMKDKTGMFKGNPSEVANNYKNGIQRIPRAFQTLTVPMIAAVNGAALGAGNDLACMCDIRIASEKAVFAESFVKVGIIPGDGGCWLLPRVIGYAHAAQLALSGDSIDAHEALRIGLVTKVVASDTLLQEALALAQSIAKNPPQVLRWTKQLMQEAKGSSLDQALDRAGELQGLAHQTADHMEALNAFFEKRAPVFLGH